MSKSRRHVTHLKYKNRTILTLLWSLVSPIDSTDYTVHRNTRIALDKRIAFLKAKHLQRK